MQQPAHPPVLVKTLNTPLCQATFDYASSQYPAFLLNHVLRSYWFAHALGQQMDVKYDPELLYVACLLHDLGLTDVAPVKTRFEVEGADAAKTFLEQRGVDAQRQEVVWDAIALHTTHVIPQRKGAEIALCQLGTAIDVGFAPVSLLPDAFVAEVIDTFPRLAFKECMVGALCGLLHRNPDAAFSPAVADVGERRVPGFQRTHFCDVIAGAAFSE